MIDFLYADHERVASLVSQIEGVGSLVGYERAFEKEASKTVGLKGGVPILSAEKGRGTNFNKQLRQAYDPLWVNSMKLISVVSESQVTQDTEFTYGKLVTLSGKLICLDQSFISNLLRSDAVVDQIAKGIEVDHESRSAKVKSKERSELAGIIRDFIQSLPLGIVFILFSHRKVFWFNVKREYLSLQSLDIPLKFPVSIGGNWHVTGLIDAMPQDHADILSTLQDPDYLKGELVLPEVFGTLAQLVTPLVGMFGRSADSYGLSPVIIHREISL